MALGSDAPPPNSFLLKNSRRIFSSSSVSFLKDQTLSASSSNTTEPSVPLISIFFKNPGYTLVEPSITPRAPFSNLTVATAVSSTSIRSWLRVAVYASTSSTFPTNHCNKSIAWID